MNEIELKRINEITKEIDEIESFLFYAKKTWYGRLRKKEYTLFSNAFGSLKEKELNLKTEIKNEMLKVLEKYVEKLKEERGF